LSKTGQQAHSSAPPGAWDPEQSIPQRFEFVARQHATSLAVADGDVSLSYGELDRLANRMAGVLRTLPPDLSSPVAIFLPHGAAHIASTLGVLKAGGFYLPLDPHAPAERNEQLLSEAAARIVVTDTRHHTPAAALAREGQRIVNIDCLEETAADGTADQPVAPTALAYILYTSGSTGKPKGVMHTHRNVLHNALRHADIYGISPLDRQTLLYAPTVYGGQRDMYNALLNGASLHVYAVKQQGMVGLKEWLAARQISIYCSVTTVFRHLCDTLTDADHFAHLRLIKLGGEASYRTDVERFKRHFSTDCVLHCGLGSTETGLARSLFVHHSTPVTGDTVALGYPVTDMQVLVCDETGSPVADGVLGEIAIRSQYVALGYWRDPALTRAAFVVDPVDPRFRTYFTGDLGVIASDGCLEHRGRRDFQIKIRGNRVEPAEIEIALLRQPGIKEAAVVAWKAEGTIDKLVAFLVGPEERRPTKSALHDALAKSLPAHMIPSHFCWLEVLPTLPNGKLDRKTLSVRRMPMPIERASEATPPRTPLEARLAGVWCAVLDTETVGVHDNFFGLGGDSLAAMILLTRLDEEFGLDISPATFADNATIDDLAKLIGANDKSNRFPVLVPIRTSGTQAPIFCVPWLLTCLKRIRCSSSRHRASMDDHFHSRPWNRWQRSTCRQCDSSNRTAPTCCAASPSAVWSPWNWRGSLRLTVSR
jgi:amino acid adenylation domain-containing protein